MTEATTTILDFQVRLQQAIKYREDILNPENRLFKLPIGYRDEELVRVQMEVYRDILEEFESVFRVKELGVIKENI
jgi:hypothetical protein